MLLQQQALLKQITGSRPVRVTLDGQVYGTDAPLAEKLFAYAPGRVPAPALFTVVPDGTLPVLGAVRMPKGIVRGVVADGQIVAWAVARLPVDGVSHITVETDRNYRRRGYATACLQALVQATNVPLLYLCDSRNTHSAKTAEAAGFVRIGTLEQ